MLYSCKPIGDTSPYKNLTLASWAVLIFHTFSPVCVPINWQTELITSASEKFEVLTRLCDGLPGVDLNPCEWPTGYGSLEHDNLPVFYQPAAELTLRDMMQESDVLNARLFCYDNCLAVLAVELETTQELASINDLAVTQRIEELAAKYLNPVLLNLYEKESSGHLISPKAYKFYADSHEALCNGKPLWVARMLVKAPDLEPTHYHNWLQCVDDTSDVFLLGSGNSLLCDELHVQDIQRAMILSQFHAALMLRTEALLEKTLTQFNGAYFNKNRIDKRKIKLNNSVDLHQYRNDHIEFISIQYSAAQAGMQGKRRQLLSQFDSAWQVQEQQQRLQQLALLVQKRLDRLVDESRRAQTRSIQTVLTFLGALSLLALVVDLASLSNEMEHGDTTGILDLFTLLSPENVLSVTVLVVVLLTAYFYKSHE